MSTTVEHLIAVANNLPEAMQAEVLDFAEFLRARRLPPSPSAGGPRLLDLCGGLQSSTTFADSPLTIQRDLRNEWP